MKGIVFGATSGVVVAVAGASLSEEPLKTIALIATLCIAHAFTGSKQ